MLDIIYNTIGWGSANPSEKKVLSGPTFVKNKKEKRFQWVNLLGELTDIPCEELALQIWSEDLLSREPCNGNALYVKAYLLYRRGEYQTALKIINQVLIAHKNNEWANILKGDILFSLKDFAEAIHWYQGVITQDVHNLLAWQGKGIWLFKEEDFNRSAQFLETVNLKIAAGEIPPSQISILYHQRGELFFAIGEYERAKEAFENAVRMDSSDQYAKKRVEESEHALKNLSSEEWVNKYRGLMERNNLSEALRCIDEALRIDPLNIENLNLKVKLLTRWNKWREALKCLETIVEINPENIGAWFQKAVLFQKLDNEHEALKSAYKAFKRDPNFMPALRIIVDIRYKYRGYEKTMSKLPALLTLSSLDILTLKQKALDFMGDKRELEVIACAEEILSRDGEQTDALFLKGMSLAILKKYNDALICANALLVKDPRHLLGLQLKATIFDLLNRHEDSWVCYEMLVENGCREVDVLQRKAWMEYLLRKYSRALVTLETILTLQPDNPEYLCLKGDILFWLEEYESAYSCYQAVLKTRPHFMAALQGEAIWYLFIGKNEKARELFGEVDNRMTRESDTIIRTRIYNQRGMFFYKVKDYHRAQEAFAKTLAVNPGDDFAQKRLGEVKAAVEESANFSSYSRSAEYGTEAFQEALCELIASNRHPILTQKALNFFDELFSSTRVPIPYESLARELTHIIMQQNKNLHCPKNWQDALKLSMKAFTQNKAWLGGFVLHFLQERCSDNLTQALVLGHLLQKQQGTSEGQEEDLSVPRHLSFFGTASAVPRLAATQTSSDHIDKSVNP